MKKIEKKHIAIITPCMLPVPAVLGGAVEVLITHLVEENEKSGKYLIDLYTIANEQIKDVLYAYTNVIQVTLDVPTYWADRIMDKLCRTLPLIDYSFRVYDTKIAKAFQKRTKELMCRGICYEAIVVQNMISLATQIQRSMKKLNLTCPVYFHMHNDIDIYRSRQGLKRLSKCGVQFIAISNYIASQIRSAADAAEVHLLYNGIDRDLFSSKEKIVSKEIVYFFSGRFIPEKGIVELLEAFERLVKETENSEEKDGVQVKLVLAGSANFSRPTLTDYEKQIKGIVERLPETIIELAGRVSEKRMIELYNRADVVMIPSIWEEPFGMVALEAMAMGKPIISTYSGGLAEILDEAFAIPVDYKNREQMIEDLKAAMLQLQSEEKRDRMGHQAFDTLMCHPEFWKENFYSNFDRILQ